MRQNSKNNRSRGRGGRKGPNPLTKSYESNGPDVKVRGTAQHVAEKYSSLARDALSSGDTIAAESYFQHAEHYNRIIMAAQAHANAQQEERRAAMQAAENSDQPRVEQQNGDQPIVVENGATPQSEEETQSAVNGNGAESEAQPDVVAEGDSEPKPRQRRASGRGRPRTPRAADGDESSSSTKTEKPTTTSDKIADNPPAFLMNE